MGSDSTTSPQLATNEAILFSTSEPINIFLIDIPKSIEISQGATCQERLHSVEPLDKPFVSLDPKSAKAKASLPTLPVEDLILQRFLKLAAAEVKEKYTGPWYLPRLCVLPSQGDAVVEGIPGGKRRFHPSEPSRKKRKEPCISPEQSQDYRGLSEPSHETADAADGVNDASEGGSQSSTSSWFSKDANDNKFRIARRSKGLLEDESAVGGKSLAAGNPNEPLRLKTPLIKNDSISERNIGKFDSRDDLYFLPPRSTGVMGDIEATAECFDGSAPKFDFIIMDPPWPNRSARRKKGYNISYSSSSIDTLLKVLPLHNHISDNGYVAVWITNKEVFRGLVLDRFEAWDVTLVEELIWLKITSAGEPICAVDSVWKKPYEALLVGKRSATKQSVERKVIMAMPDIHSRKPSAALIKELICGTNAGDSLEIFARNLVSGWWSWGSELLKFQDVTQWSDSKK